MEEVKEEKKVEGRDEEEGKGTKGSYLQFSVFVGLFVENLTLDMLV